MGLALDTTILSSNPNIPYGPQSHETTLNICNIN